MWIKYILFLNVFLISTSLLSQKKTNYCDLIDTVEIKKHATLLASDSFKGRNTLDESHFLAANYIKKHFQNIGLNNFNNDYFQMYDLTNFSHEGKSVNVIGYIKGRSRKLSKEFIVISGHYDHLGVDMNGNVYNGADDNASGTSTILELARVFQQAKKKKLKTKRSLLFVLFSGEEHGLYGSTFFVENCPVSIDKIVANFNIDMIGRDPSKTNKKTLYLIGSDKISMDFHNKHNKIATSNTLLSIDYTFNDDKHPEQLYYRSDHYNFAKKGIPCVFYFGGFHEDYHQITDDVEKLDFLKIQYIAQLIFKEINFFGN